MASIKNRRLVHNNSLNYRIAANVAVPCQCCIVYEHFILISIRRKTAHIIYYQDYANSLTNTIELTMHTSCYCLELTLC